MNRVEIDFYNFIKRLNYKLVDTITYMIFNNIFLILNENVNKKFKKHLKKYY